ncbi:hydrolase [Rheinheimera sp.]|uniref:hydrolase n=1 Tax=Rheinheimera sp. TaxID=1869214 RepID=UPI00307E549F
MNLQAQPVSVQHPPPFKPAWWLRNCHLQTIAAKYLAPRRQAPAFSEMLALPDGDQLELSWTEAPAVRPDTPLVIVLHGLEGNIHSHYAAGMLAALQQQGFTAVLMHFRGCNGQPNRLPRAYHSGDTADLAYLIAQLQHQYPTRPLAAVGFSLGGNVLVKYAGETGSACPLKALVAVSAPLALAPSADRINQGSSRIYQHYLLGRLKRSMLAKLKRHTDFPLPITPQQILSLRSIRQFDDVLTAPLHGFSNADDYYRQCSGKAYLKQIQKPTLLIHAEDDPFLSAAVVPKADEMPPWVSLVLSKRGGHVGFVSGAIPLKPRYYLDQHVPAYLQQFFPQVVAPC